MTLQEYFMQTTETTILWHTEKNDTLIPEKIKTGSHKKVWWRCDKGHSWQAPVYFITISGGGCPYCSGMRAISGENDLATQFPEMAKEWDHVRNGSLAPNNMLPQSRIKVWWRCELGHSWKAAPYSRTRENGSGCPYCTGKKVLPGFNDLATLKPALAKEWYHPLNGDLKPSDVTPGSNKKVWWRCSEGHVWQAAIYARTRQKGTGCPICAKSARVRGKACADDAARIDFEVRKRQSDQQKQKLQQEAV